MTENIGATPAASDPLGQGAADASAPSASAQQTSQPDEYAKLLSRISGLDAKTTELQKQAKAAEDARLAAEARLREYEAGKVSADEALKSQLAEKERELEAARREAKVGKIAAAYPETFGVFGEAVVNMTPDQLAAAEARFAGTPGTGYRSPGANPARESAGTKDPRDMSLEELRKAVKSAPESAWAQSWSGKPIRDW